MTGSVSARSTNALPRFTGNFYFRDGLQLYELISLLLVLVILWRTQFVALPGEIFWRGVALYSLVQLLVEAFRANLSTWAAGIRTAQVVALVVLIAAMFILSFYMRRREQNAQSVRAAPIANR